ncbi:MAG: hypothetical protein RL095_3527 [Verrucomicrobiota bacterium]|jgi:phenylalanyl-tRNA synthetase beta chain
MKLSLSWIQEFTDAKIDLTPLELSSKISLSVAEVEDVHVTGVALTQVRVCEILATQPHPNADKLRLATIRAGGEERQIVCGAGNCRPGIKVPFADLGAKLPYTDKEGKPAILEIKKAAIRGVESTGMLCSAKELGLAEASDGLLELPDSTPVGAKLSELPAYRAEADLVLEIDNKSLTHRPDLWGHYGFAREFAAVFGGALKPYPGLEPDSKATSAWQVAIANPELCRRYSCLEVEGLDAGPSPEWLQTRLRQGGIGSINKLVDVTNFILLELGQPMHAFDADKLAAKQVSVRAAAEGESFAALNGQSYTLKTSDLVIDIGGRAEALAGVMGGAHSAVSASTTRLLLESANFHAAGVRRTATRTGLRSDSSARFEKSLDPENCDKALRRAWQLLKELCPAARCVGGIVDSYPAPYPALSIQTSYAFLASRLGTDVGKAFIDDKLARLGFSLKGDLDIAIPSWRATKDVAIAEDIVEEIGRLYGYDNIPSMAVTLPDSIPAPNPARKLERELKNVLANGWNATEIMSYPWCGDKELATYGLKPDGLMTLVNSLSEDAKYMKTTDIPKIIAAVSENLKYRDSFRLFNFTRVYDTTVMKGLLPTERFQFTGAFVPAADKKDALQTQSFADAKACVLDLLRTAGLAGFTVEELRDKSAPWIHPGIACGLYRGKQLIAQIFKLHPAVAATQDIKANAYLFQVDFDALVGAERKFKYKPVARFPSVDFDITALVNERALAGSLQTAITKALGASLTGIEVVSIYQGDNLGPGKKTISYRMTVASDERTLAPDEILDLNRKAVKAVLNAGAEIPNLPEVLKS